MKLLVALAQLGSSLHGSALPYWHLGNLLVISELTVALCSQACVIYFIHLFTH